MFDAEQLIAVIISELSLCAKQIPIRGIAPKFIMLIFRGNLMQRWERRLTDAAHALSNCGKTYFEPELFRRNVNQFLTLVRTVTFLIAKDKANIPDYESWLSSAIGKYWSGDEIMLWAKESRNYIEKEGDLELYSSLSVALVYSYFTENDVSIEIGRSELVGGGVKKLMRFAEAHLPHGVRAAAAVKIERRWVANTLPNYELLQGMIYVYSRYRQACADLSHYLGITLSPTIPTAESIGEGNVHGRRVSYVKFSDKASYSMATYRVDIDRALTPPIWIKDVDQTRPIFEIYAEMAERTFLHFGEHLAMAFLFAEDGKILQHFAFSPFDQVDKFIFWRSLSEKIVYLRAESLIFVTESWMRRDPGLVIPIAEAEILGEMLHLYEIKRTGEACVKAWNIERLGDQLSLAADRNYKLDTSNFPNFLVPVQAAFARIHKR